MGRYRVTPISDIERLPFNGYTDTRPATSDTLLWQSIEAVKPSRVNTWPIQIWFPVLTTTVITSRGMLRPNQTWITSIPFTFETRWFVRNHLPQLFVNRVEYFYVQGIASFLNFAIVAIYLSKIWLSSLVRIMPFQLRTNFKLSTLYDIYILYFVFVTVLNSRLIILSKQKYGLEKLKSLRDFSLETSTAKRFLLKVRDCCVPAIKNNRDT